MGRQAQQHVLAARPRRRPRRRPRGPASATGCAPVLPTLLAVSRLARRSYDGMDSGLHSARTQMFTRTFPRCGVPDALRRLGGVRASTSTCSMRTNSIVEYTQVWWSVRPHFRFGTVEVRICDAQPTAQESEALAGADRRLRRCRPPATSTRACPSTDLPRPADRGEHLARDPPRHGRHADRPRRAARRSTRGPALERLLAWTAPARARARLARARAARAQRAPSASARCIAEGLSPQRGLRCHRARDRSHLRRRRSRPHEHAAQTPAGQPTEEELRAAYEAEIKRLRVEDVLVQTVVSLVNLGGRKAGLAPGTEDERDPEQLRDGDRGRAGAAAAGRGGARAGRRPGPRRAQPAADGLRPVAGGEPRPPSDARRRRAARAGAAAGRRRAGGSGSRASNRTALRPISAIGCPLLRAGPPSS